jgi:hypothetical protein
MSGFRRLRGLTAQVSSAASLTALLTRLESVESTPPRSSLQVQSPEHVDFNFSSTNWYSDWVHDRYGTGWYKRVAHECMVFLVDTSDNDFADKRDDFRPELIEFQKRCERASVAKKTIRTPELENEILRMWTPLGPKLEKLKEKSTKTFHEQPKGNGRLSGQVRSITDIQDSMAGLPLHAKDLAGL